MDRELSPRMLAQSRVIAKGRRIRDLQRLIAEYGGRPSKWVKKSSPIISLGDGHYEYHWYENPDVGRVEVKRKRVSNT